MAKKKKETFSVLTRGGIVEVEGKFEVDPEDEEVWKKWKEEQGYDVTIEDGVPSWTKKKNHGPDQHILKEERVDISDFEAHLKDAVNHRRQVAEEEKKKE